ncbi:hypothetical protein ABTM86_19395 [Acinetobacter baumannii]
MAATSPAMTLPRGECQQLISRKMPACRCCRIPGSSAGGSLAWAPLDVA